MPLSRDEAQTALSDIGQAERRSANAYGYSMASPHLLVWGVIWVIGYGVTYFRPDWAWVWPVLGTAGTIVSCTIAWRLNKGASGRSDWRYFATFLAIFLFVVALFSIMPPRTVAQISAFCPLLVALLYAIIGIWTGGARLVLTGIAVAALTVGGYFWLPQYFLLWLAVVGGGALILGGLWLRRV